MRISIWQEFGSNNSARFTVVGIFESAEKASRAAAELMHMVKAVLDWYYNPENAEALEKWEGGPLPPPSPVEIQFAQHYNVEWSECSLDWLYLDPDGNGPVRAFENLVLIDGTESYLGSKPADALIKKLGGEPLVDGSIIYNSDTGGDDLTGEIRVSVSCVASDETAAQAIHEEITAYLNAAKQDHTRLYDTPWRSNAVGRLSSFEGTLRREGRKLIIENGSFFHLADGFPYMIRYLQDKGCVDVGYTFTETRRGWEDVVKDKE